MSFSLRGLFAAVAISAVLVAGFAYASPFWSAIVFHMTLGVLAFATICGILSVRSRPFWISFAVVGWVHFLVNAFPLSPGSPSSKLFTRRLSYEFMTVLQREFFNVVVANHKGTPPGELYYKIQRGGYLALDKAVAVVDIAQDLFTLLLAASAGVLASYCVRSPRLDLSANRIAR
jgi:hypothetical protein